MWRAGAFVKLGLITIYRQFVNLIHRCCLFFSLVCLTFGLGGDYGMTFFPHEGSFTLVWLKPLLFQQFGLKTAPMLSFIKGWTPNRPSRDCLVIASDSLSTHANKRSFTYNTTRSDLILPLIYVCTYVCTYVCVSVLHPLVKPLSHLDVLASVWQRIKIYLKRWRTMNYWCFFFSFGRIITCWMYA